MSPPQKPLRHILTLTIISSCLSVLITSGCSKSRDWSKIDKPENFRCKQEKEGVTVAVEAWINDDELEDVFKKDFAKKNILPLRILIYNNGDYTIRFSSTQAKLQLEHGPFSSALTDSQVKQKTQSNESALPVLIYAISGGYAGAIAVLVEQGNIDKNLKMQSAVRETSIDFVVLDPGEAMVGFLFFECPVKKMHKKHLNPQAKLLIKRVCRYKNKPLDFDLVVYF